MGSQLWRRAVFTFGLLLLFGCSDDGGYKPSPPCGEASPCDAQVGLENTEARCQDGHDNDGDGFADCKDQDCWDFAFCKSPPTDGSVSDSGASDLDSSMADGPLPDGPPADGPLVDLPLADVQPGDGGPPLPNCPSGCNPDQICLKGSCVTVGPDKACGSGKYGPNLPTSNVLHVDGSYNGASDGSASKPFKTIAAALAAIPAAATAPYTVAIAGGAYQEAVTITKDVSMRCRCPSMVTISETVTIEPPLLSAGVTVTIEGCTISPAGFSSSKPADWGACDPLSPEDPKGIYAKGSNSAISLLVKDSVVGGWCLGIYFSAAPFSSSSFCLHRARLVANVRGLDVQTAPTIASSSFTECKPLSEGVAAQLSHIEQSRDYGVHTRQNAQGISLQGNLVERSGRVGAKTGGMGYGIYLGDSDTASVTANRIVDNEGRGLGLRNLKVQSATAIQIVDNALSGNKGAGIALQQLQAAKSVTISGNLIQGTGVITNEPGGDGIQISVENGPAYNVAIHSNTITASQRNGIIIDEAGGTVTSNSITSSGEYGILLQKSGASADQSNTILSSGTADKLVSSTKVHLVGSLPMPIP